jgi:glc operon protein GlcG
MEPRARVVTNAAVRADRDLRKIPSRIASPSEGGLPVILDGTIIGAIGVSGALSSQDAQVARAGAAAVVK